MEQSLVNPKYIEKLRTMVTKKTAQDAQEAQELIKANLLKGRIPILSRFAWPSDPVSRALIPWFRQHRSVVKACLNDEPKAQRLIKMIESIENCYQEKKVIINKRWNDNTQKHYSSRRFWELILKPPMRQTKKDQELRSLRNMAKSCLKRTSIKVLEEIEEESIITDLLVKLGFPAMGWGLESGHETKDTIKKYKTWQGVFFTMRNSKKLLKS